MGFVELWITAVIAVATWRVLYYAPRDRFICWHCHTKQWVRWTLLTVTAVVIIVHGNWHWPDISFLMLAIATELS